ncbi:MAG TPA: hypothetical protein VHO91_14685 [Rhodopila sp.]|nr:hypothetical protein [Rhodopila sp.]
MSPQLFGLLRLVPFAPLNMHLPVSSRPRNAVGRLCRVIMVALATGCVVPAAAYADAVTIDFSATVGAVNSIDIGNLFGEGANVNLAGQTMYGIATIDPSALVERCVTAGACYADNGAGAMTMRFTLNGITHSVISAGTLGYLGNTSGGLVSINDLAHGGDNYLSVGVTSPDGLLQESIGALFNAATLLSAYGTGTQNASGSQVSAGSASAAITSLAAIGGGGGLVAGGITLLTPLEHIDATVTSISAPEPASCVLLLPSLCGLWRVRRRRVACSRRDR